MCVPVKRSVVSEPLPSLEEDGEVEVEITYVPKLYPGADQTILSEERIEDEIQDKHYKKWGERYVAFIIYLFYLKSENI